MGARVITDGHALGLHGERDPFDHDHHAQVDEDRRQEQHLRYELGEDAQVVFEVAE